MTRLVFFLCILPQQLFFLAILDTYLQNPDFFDTLGRGVISGDYLFILAITLSQLVEFFLCRARLLDMNWPTFWAYLMSLIIPSLIALGGWMDVMTPGLYDAVKSAFWLFFLILIFKR